MRQHAWTMGLRLLALTALLVSGTALAQQDVEEVADDLVGRWQEAFNAGDAAAVADLYAQDAGYYIAGNVFEGPAAIEDLLEGDFEAGVGPIEIEPLERRALGEAVYEIGQWRLEGPEGEPLRGHHVVVVERVDGAWKITRHFVNRAPPEAPAEN